MLKIKFGTDGWRAIIAQEYTVANLKRAAQGTALWLNENFPNSSVVIGYDTRFGGQLFAETAARVLCASGIKAFLCDAFVSTPMVSMGTKRLGAKLGIVITASHNPPDYNGFKLKSQYGGPSAPNVIQQVEDKIPDVADVKMDSLENYENDGLIEYVDLEKMYIDTVNSHFDLEKINNGGFIVAYDAMYGAGQNVIPQILTNYILLHCDYNPSFKGQAPEPIDKNLRELASTIQNATGNVVGLATDGDADRIGFYDEDGNFVDAHHIILLLIHYLHKYKGLNGKVVVAFSVSDKVKKMCEIYNLPIEITKIGFKYISEKMVAEDVLVGGEESGGIAVKGHIPERDGIWDGLILLEFMALTGKTMKELIAEVYSVVGPFSFDRLDLHLDESLKQEIIHNCEQNKYTSFGPYKVQSVETIDGFKYHFNDTDWVMIRPSGTEPLLRVYCESTDKNKVQTILREMKSSLLPK